MAEEAMEVEEVIEEKDDLVEEEMEKKFNKFMTFKSGAETFGIELKYVNEIMGIQPITAIPEVEEYIKGLINLRGKIVPVIDVRIRFHQEPFDYNDRTCIIIVNVKGTTVGLIVETIADVVTLAGKDIEPPPSLTPGHAKNNYVYGLGKMEDRVVLLLNPEKLLKDEDLEALGEIADSEEGE